MNLYTIILDLKGGTYISQINETNEKGALNNWRDSIDDLLPELDIAYKNSIRNSNAFELIPLSGLENVWCSSELIGDSLALISIIRTQSISPNNEHKL
jgi:hypothetical protein